jgi:hypothetical protein
LSPTGARDECLLAATAQDLQQLAKLILLPEPKPARGGFRRAITLQRLATLSHQIDDAMQTLRVGRMPVTKERRDLLAADSGQWLWPSGYWRRNKTYGFAWKRGVS